MAQFQYRAMDAKGKVTDGNIDAINLADLELRLGRLGMDLIRAHEAQPRISIGGRRRITRRDLIGFCLHMEQLTRAGVPILDGLGDLRDTLENPAFRMVLAALIESIEGGATLSEAMEKFPAIFDRIMVSLVRAGEQSGELASIFRSLGESIKWQDEQIALTKKLMTYPILLGIVLITVILFLMIYLVPQLVGFIKSMGEELPAHTRALIATSRFFVDYWYVVLGLPIAAILALRYLAGVSPALRLRLDGLKLRLWVIGPLLQKSILARFSNYFALMYASGITVLESIRIGEDVVGNRAIGEALRRAGQQIAEGASISTSFEYAGLFPPLVLRMLKVGENTGELDNSLMNISYFYNRDVKESIERLQTLIGPVLTAVLGSILLWVIVSVLGPIYDLITNLKY